MCNIQQQPEQSKVCYSMNRSFSCTEYFAQEKISSRKKKRANIYCIPWCINSAHYLISDLPKKALYVECVGDHFPLFCSLRQFSSLRFQPWLVFTFFCAVSFFIFAARLVQEPFSLALLCMKHFMMLFFLQILPAAAAAMVKSEIETKFFRPLIQFPLTPRIALWLIINVSIFGWIRWKHSLSWADMISCMCCRRKLWRKM